MVGPIHGHLYYLMVGWEAALGFGEWTAGSQGAVSSASVSCGPCTVPRFCFEKVISRGTGLN